MDREELNRKFIGWRQAEETGLPNSPLYRKAVSPEGWLTRQVELGKVIHYEFAHVLDSKPSPTDLKGHDARVEYLLSLDFARPGKLVPRLYYFDGVGFQTEHSRSMHLYNV